MLTSPRIPNKFYIRKEKPLMGKDNNADKSFLISNQELSPWNSEEHSRNPMSHLPFKTISQHRYKPSKPPKNPEYLPFSNAQSKQVSNKRTSKVRDMKTQQKRLDSPLKANLISISLEEEREKEASQTTQYRFRWGARDNWTEEPNRVKLLKKKRDRSLQAQQEQVYNKTLQMFSTCLTERFSKELIEDTLLIYPAMPKRASKVTQVRTKAQGWFNIKERILPNLIISGINENNAEFDSVQFKKSTQNWKQKGEDIKIKIKQLMLRENQGRTVRRRLEIDGDGKVES